MTIRLGAFTTTYDELDWLEAIAPQLAAFDHAVVVLSTTPMAWYLASGPDSPERPPLPDVAHVRRLCSEHGFDLIVGEFSRGEDAWLRGQEAGISSMARQRTAGIRALLDCDAAAWFAPDELYTDESVKALADAMRSDPTARYTPATTHTLWWNERWEFGGDYWAPIPGLPISFDPYAYDMGRTTTTSEWASTSAPGVTCWHFAFARSDEEMRKKFFSWGHSHEQHSHDHWKRWDGWQPGLRSYWPPNPIVPVTEPLPEDIRQRIAPLLARMRPLGR